jgi:hypothetical protein
MLDKKNIGVWLLYTAAIVIAQVAEHIYSVFEGVFGDYIFMAVKAGQRIDPRMVHGVSLSLFLLQAVGYTMGVFAAGLVIYGIRNRTVGRIIGGILVAIALLSMFLEPF